MAQSAFGSRTPAQPAFQQVPVDADGNMIIDVEGGREPTPEERLQQGIAQIEAAGGMGYLIWERAKQLGGDVAATARSMMEAAKADPVGFVWQMVNPMNVVNDVVDAERGYKEAIRSGDFGGALNNAFGGPGAALSMMIGVKGRGVDLDALERAKEMQSRGLSRDEIWKETLWAQGPDGQWKTEISDLDGDFDRSKFPDPDAERRKVERLFADSRGVPSILHLPPTDPDRIAAHKAAAQAYEKAKNVTLPAGEIFPHPRLYENYPELADLPLKVGDMPGTYKGYYQPGDTPNIGVGRHMSAPEQRSTALHELQHAVQEIEGFGKGSNPTVALQTPEGKRLLKERRANLRQQSTLPYEAFVTQTGGVDSPEMRAVYDDYVRELRTMKIPKDIDNQLRSSVAYDWYRRQSGETEARTTQARRDLGMGARASSPPWDWQDVPDEDQFVNFNSGPSASDADVDEVAERAWRQNNGGPTLYDPAPPADWGYQPTYSSRKNLPTPNDIERTVEAFPMTPRRSVTPEDIYRQAKGGQIIAGMADRLDVGRLTSINGELIDPIDMEGGLDFIRRNDAAMDPNDPRTGGVWAGDKAPMSRVSTLAQQADGPTIYAPFLMQGTAVDYSVPMTRLIADQMRNVPQATRSAFDDKFRSIMPNFAGFADPDRYEEALAQLVKGRGARTRLAEMLDNKDAAALGLPEVSTLRSAITDPNLANAPTEAFGYNLGWVDPGGRMIDDPLYVNETYARHIAAPSTGGYAGSFDVPLPVNHMLPDYYEMVKDAKRRGDVAYGLKFGPKTQKIDQRWLDIAMPAYEQLVSEGLGWANRAPRGR